MEADLIVTFVAMVGGVGVAVAVLSRWYDQRAVRQVKRAVNALPCRTVSELVEGERAWVAGSVRALAIADFERGQAHVVNTYVDPSPGIFEG